MRIAYLTRWDVSAESGVLKKMLEQLSAWEAAGHEARLFALSASSWADYDSALISPGGGIFPRSQKAIPLSPEAAIADPRPGPDESLDEAQRNGATLDMTRMVDGFYAEVQGLGGRRWDTSSLVARLETPAQ